MSSNSVFFFFFNDTATTEIYTLSLHDALPISAAAGRHGQDRVVQLGPGGQVLEDRGRVRARGDRKSTRLNSSHLVISYAVFCLKKKNRLEIVNRRKKNILLTICIHVLLSEEIC